MLGGAATHFALAASFFTEVRVVGPVGDDFDDVAYAVLRTRGTNTNDVEHIRGGKSFYWAGEYGADLNSRATLQLTRQPNVVSAARQLLWWGPSVVVAKQGEYGATLVSAAEDFAVPAYPRETCLGRPACLKGAPDASTV
jgi:hypothetical protein